MAETIRNLMTPNPAAFKTTDSVLEAARAMRDGDFGAVVVVEDGGNVAGSSPTATSWCEGSPRARSRRRRRSARCSRPNR